jgi:hypothetical protein
LGPEPTIEAKTLGAVAPKDVLDERLDLELVEPGLDRKHRGAFGTSGDVGRGPDACELAGGLRAAQLLHDWRRVLHDELGMPLSQRGNALLVRCQRRAGATIVGGQVADHVHGETCRRERVEDRGPLAHDPRRDPGALPGGVDTEASADPDLARGNPRLDEERARGRAPRLRHHEHGVGLEKAGEVVERWGLIKGEIVLHRLVSA